jgi:hypothetical protein
MIPPPITTTPVRAGSAASDTTGSTGGDMDAAQMWEEAKSAGVAAFGVG